MGDNNAAAAAVTPKEGLPRDGGVAAVEEESLMAPESVTTAQVVE